MIRTATYLEKYIASGEAGRAQRYVDRYCGNAWTKNVDRVREMVDRATSCEEIRAADDYNFQKTRDFMEIYFQSPEYVSELENEVAGLVDPDPTVALLVHGLAEGTLKGIDDATY